MSRQRSRRQPAADCLEDAESLVVPHRLLEIPGMEKSPGSVCTPQWLSCFGAFTTPLAQIPSWKGLLLCLLSSGEESMGWDKRFK